MSAALRKTLDQVREQSSSRAQQGITFEEIAKVFLKADSIQSQEFSEVWHYTDWAKNEFGAKGYSSTDIGIDLVAKLRDESGFCAIQCKLYQPEHSISKKDIDSFISASATADFKRLVLIDTSSKPMSKQAISVLENLEKPFNRLGMDELYASPIDWDEYIQDKSIRFHDKHELRSHQTEALQAVREGLEQEDRGKLIMACGTGKTLTSLRIAEDLVGSDGGSVLYMVPSLALMSQTIREWKNHAADYFTAYAVCSDASVGKRIRNDDVIEINPTDLALPATTNAARLAEKFEHDRDVYKARMSVVFSTYQSIDTITVAQNEHGLPAFDLIICDEAHRTTGVKIASKAESNFTRIHSNDYVKGNKRLYMTATPRIYAAAAKKKAEEKDAVLASMDDVKNYGNVLFRLGFGDAVQQKLLSDYKVIVLAVDEQFVNQRVHSTLGSDSDLQLNDAAKIVGCYRALGKVGFQNHGEQDGSERAMSKALAYCNTIDSSKLVANQFRKVIDEYEGSNADLDIEIEHVDGTTNAVKRNEMLDWLKEDNEDSDRCRILTNVRCLSEGVDVPALDAIIFLHPRKSQIDVVQAVGRVMRKAAGKDIGYVILPVAVAPDIPPEQALNDNERYRVVWQILNALRTHDERFRSFINRISLGEDVSKRLVVVVDDGQDKSDNVQSQAGQKVVEQLSLGLEGFCEAIMPKIVEKCGTRDYWEQWAKDIADIAKQCIVRIEGIVSKPGTHANKVFNDFLAEVRDDLNPSVSEADAVEMLVQHLITKPVFDALFPDSKYAATNAVSKALESILEQLDAQNIASETKSLAKFYESVRNRAAGIATPKARQKLVIELYDGFFRTAFPRMASQLGLAYTPVEVVDFIINSVNHILKTEFGKTLGSKNVHILDPFTGTGSFVTRLLQSGHITKEQLIYKYEEEVHANEIVLLAYYIASINIEAAFHSIVGEKEYKPFRGIVLTDTFQLFEQDEDMVADLLPDNSERRTKQRKLEITAVIGNPPYSSGQSSANDNAANIKYPNLDARIRNTYVSASRTTNNNSLYDSYIRAFRWASDRIAENGVVGFVVNAGWLDGIAAAGMRKCLSEDFDKIYLFHLRGNARKSGVERRKEGGEIFGNSSRSPITIVLMLKKGESPSSNQQCQIFYCDIGDYLSRDEKLSRIMKYGDIDGIEKASEFVSIIPDEHHDWIKQRDKSFGKFPKIGSKGADQQLEIAPIFANYSLGLASNRDAWNWNSSKEKLSDNVERSIRFYNEQLAQYQQEQNQGKQVKDYVSMDSKKISWDSGLLDSAVRNRKITYKPSAVRLGIHRPVTKRWVYAEKSFNGRTFQLPKLFPGNIRNRIIAVAGISAQSFSCQMTDLLPANHFVSPSQCFPSKLYGQSDDESTLLEKFAPPPLRSAPPSLIYPLTEYQTKVLNISAMRIKVGSLVRMICFTIFMGCCIRLNTANGFRTILQRNCLAYQR